MLKFLGDGCSEEELLYTVTLLVQSSALVLLGSLVDV